jgi:hypothetical protein
VTSLASIQDAIFPLYAHWTQKTYIITLKNGASTLSAYTFAAAGPPLSYALPSALFVTVSNTGNQPTGALTASVSDSNFTILPSGSNNIPSIVVGGTGAFTVQPTAGLDEGEYMPTVMVSGGSVSPKNFTVRFVVYQSSFYVSYNGAGNKDGSTWDNAVDASQLSSMLSQAAATAALVGLPIEVYVSAGTYTPQNGDPSDRTNTFLIGNNVKVYGGFPDGLTGITTSALMAARAARFDADGVITDAACETILSGDLTGDDSGVFDALNGDVPVNFDNNAYHVVSATAGAVLLDGFTIRSGNTDGASTLMGGGIYLTGTSSASVAATLVNLTITGNAATSNAGGIVIDFSAATLTGVTITNNKSNNAGGGVYVRNAGATFTLYSGRIANNAATAGQGLGGGLLVYQGTFIMYGGVFSGNTASIKGGGVDVEISPATFTMYGGTIYGTDAPSDLQNAGTGAAYNASYNASVFPIGTRYSLGYGVALSAPLTTAVSLTGAHNETLNAATP